MRSRSATPHPVAVQIAARAAPVPSATRLRRWARAALDGIGEAGALCIRVVDEPEMAALNARYRGRDGVTNVLSFANDVVTPDGAQRLLGDVVVCAGVVADEATKQGKTAADHWAHLVVHGVLHLCGFDHETKAQAQVMERHEAAILKRMNIDDPYQ